MYGHNSVLYIVYIKFQIINREARIICNVSNNGVEGGALIIIHSGHDEMFRFNNYMIIVTLYDERDLI